MGDSRRRIRGARRRAALLRLLTAVSAIVALTATTLLIGPMPRAFAAAGEETIWIGPDTDGDWTDPANWSNGQPGDESIVVFETPAHVDPSNAHLRGSTFEFRPGASGARLDSSSEYRPTRIVVGEGVAVELGLRLLQIGQGSTLTIAMSDHSRLDLTRQVQPDVVVESTKLIDGVGPQQADLEDAVIRIGSGDWLTAPIQLGGNVRLELDKRISGNVHPVTAPTSSAGETASPTAGHIVWLRDEQLFDDSDLVLDRGLSAELGDHRQTLRTITLDGADMTIGEAGVLRLEPGEATAITVLGEGQSRIAGGRIKLLEDSRIVVGAGELQLASTLAGEERLDVLLDGGSLVLDDACGHTGTLSIQGAGTVTATRGFGGVVEVADGDARFVDGSGGECASATIEPGPPINVIATPLEDRIGAKVRWTMPIRSGTNAPIGYELYRSADPAQLGTKIADLPPYPTGNWFEYLDEWDEELEGWATYYYRLITVSPTGSSEPSSQARVVTLGPPASPSSLSVLNGRGRVKLSWPRSTSPNVDAYFLYRSTAYSAPTADDVWAGRTPLEWATPFGEDGGEWERIGEFWGGQTEIVDDLSLLAPADSDTERTLAFPFERSWNYYVTSYSADFGESEPVMVAAGTPSSLVELTMSLAQETSAYPGARAVFLADASNLAAGPTSGDLTMRLLIPSTFDVNVMGPAGEFVTPSSDTPADGDGDGSADWSCSASTIGEATMLRCTHVGPLWEMSTSAPLPFSLDIPLAAALGTVPISYAVSGTNADGELGTASNKPFLFDVEEIQRASLEPLIDFDGVLSARPDSPSLLTIAVRNTGAAATLDAPRMTLDVPDGTRLATGYVSDAWRCRQASAGADVVCDGNAAEFLGGGLLAGAVSPEALVALVTPATDWNAPAVPLPIGVRVSATDAYGAVSADAQLTGTSTVAAAPILEAGVVSRPVGELGPGGSGFTTTLTNAGGATRSALATLVLRLPEGIALVTPPRSSGWDCDADGTTVECVSTEPVVVEPGTPLIGPAFTTRPMSEALVAAGHWQVAAHVAHDGAVSVPTTAAVEIAPLKPPATTSISIVPADAPLKSRQRSSATVTITADEGAGAAAPRDVVALLPGVVDATGAVIAVDGFGIAAAEWGSCEVIDAAEGPFPGAGDALHCRTDAPVPPGASATVTVSFRAGIDIEGELPFVAGFAPDGDRAAVIDALRAAGAGALGEPSVASVEGRAFVADAGAPQRVDPTVISAEDGGEPEVRPALVRLAGSVEGALGDPVAYCWVQTGGPAVTWVASGNAAVAPGTSGLPEFPAGAGAPGSCEAGGFSVADDHWFGESATFLAPQTRDGAEVALRLYVTDGSTVVDASTTVEVAAAGNTPPSIGEVALLELDGSAWTEIADASAKPAAGTRLRLRIAVDDPDGDRVVVTPWLMSGRSSGVVFASTAESTPTVQELEFRWPTGVERLDIGLLASDGRVSTGGVPGTATASIGIGPSAGPRLDPPLTAPAHAFTVAAPWKVARGLDLGGWLANGPIDAPAGSIPPGYDIRHPYPEDYIGWEVGPLTLVDLQLRTLAAAPEGCTAASGAPDEVVLGLRANASIDWNGRDTKDSDLAFVVEGCIVPGAGWDLRSAGAIKRLDISDLPDPIVFRDATFIASSRERGEDKDPIERYEFFGAAQAKGADGPARMHVWIPGREDADYGTTTYAITIETRMSDLSLYYGDDGYLVYTPTGLASLSDIPGFELDAGADHDPDVCRGTAERHGDVPLRPGFSAVTNYRVDAEFCELLGGIGIPMAGVMPMVTPVTAVPMGTIFLSGGEVRLFHEPESGIGLTASGLRLVYGPNTLQLIADGSLSLPDLLHVLTAGRLGSEGDTSELEVSVGVNFATNFVKEHQAQIFLEKSADRWADAFGVSGLDIGELVVQGGINWERNLVNLGTGLYQSWIDTAFRAEILSLPQPIEDTLGIVGDEPIVMSSRLSKQSPIWDVQLGVVDGNDFMRPLKVTGVPELEQLISIDGAHLIVAPFGGFIGEHVYPWGVTLDFMAEVLGLKVGMEAHADLWGAHLDAMAEIGKVSVAGMTLSKTELGFELDGFSETAAYTFTAPELTGFEGDAQVEMSAVATGGSLPSVDLEFSALLRELDFDGVVTIHDAEIWAHRELGLTGGFSAPLAGLDYGMSASVGVLGHEIAVIGAVDLTTRGLGGIDLVGASEPLHVGSTVIGGAGCGDVSGIIPDGTVPPAFPTNGPCVRFSAGHDPQNPYLLGMSGSLTVPDAGIEAAFDGRIDGTGLAIDRAEVQLTSALAAELTDARLYFGPSVAAGQVRDTNALGELVTVAGGDFRMRGSTQLKLLGGFGSRLDLDLGSIGGSGWAEARGKLDIFNTASSPIASGMELRGAFRHADGDYRWELAGTGLVTIAGFRVAGAEVSIGQEGADSWFTVGGTLAAGPISASVAGDVRWDGRLAFDIRGTARVRFFGATDVTATLALATLPGGAVSKTLGFSGVTAGVVRLNGVGLIQSNGNFCASGTVSILSLKGDAAICHTNGNWGGFVVAEVWSGMAVGATLTSMHDFRAAAKVTLPTVKKNVNLTIEGFGLSGDFVVRDMHLTLGLASSPGSVCLQVKKNKCTDQVTFSSAGLYVEGGASFKVHGCARGGGLGKSCDHWSTGVSFKLNPVRFCGSKSFKLLGIRWTIGGCYEPPTKLYVT